MFEKLKSLLPIEKMTKGGSYSAKEYYKKKSSGYGYGYGKTETEETEEVGFLGKNSSFAVTEAFKLLRTNLSFAFPSDEKCRVMGVTGALKGVGKSLVSLNLAYTTAQTESRVLLIEGDMRMPTVARRTQLKPTPGLSNMLAGLVPFEEAVQHYSPHLDVLTAGDIPPNPSDLLGSRAMEKFLNSCKDNYDYVIVDLPPLMVSDALVVSRFLYGVVLVVRQNYDEKAATAEMMRQLHIVGVKVLGVVYNQTENGKRNYGSYNRYYNRYKSKSQNYYHEYFRTGSY
ncbi:MAG: CpsD/CapB family tyrosine-protein kinase, partial [Clostridia bacterium]|nr:CpsD/CapB family tyrosine-protein kinase [Clostridia bacterium]